MKTYIIAEVGVNHNSSLEMAQKLIDVAASVGANAVKFQSFKADKIVTRISPKAEYQISTTALRESQFEMLRRLELDEETHHKLIAHCQKSKNKIKFLSSPFDTESLDMLIRLGVSHIKIPSGEITNAPLLLKSARTGLPIILSTGMATLGEIETALGIIAFGYSRYQGNPSIQNWQEAFASVDGQKALKEKITLLHCTTEYPAPFKEINLNAMNTLAKTFFLQVGYSDHTRGIAIPIAAVAQGATVIEKHFTMNKTLPGPDHKASLDPKEFQTMVNCIREVETALGSPLKFPSPSEIKNRSIVRKSLVAKKHIRQGELFSIQNLAIKRPGTGISPLRYWDYLGKPAQKDYQRDEKIQ